MKARPMTVKLLLWLVKLAVDAAPADQSRLVSSRLVSSAVQSELSRQAATRCLQ